MGSRVKKVKEYPKGGLNKKNGQGKRSVFMSNNQGKTVRDEDSHGCYFPVKKP
jgi:hypothetical protein